MATAAIAVAAMAIAGRDNRGDQVVADAAGPSPEAVAAIAAPTTTALPDLDVVADGVVEPTPALTADCVVESAALRLGDQGADVMCLQQALIRDGYLAGDPSGNFDEQTSAAVNELQTEQDLFVDGVAGRETALAVGVWPDESANVVRTPAPPAGARDELGFALSSVSSTGDDAPPLPANSGSGRRVVYSREGQRVWAVAEDGQIIRSWLVTGSKYDNEVPGTHEVYSRSEQSTAWNGQAILPLMIRWLKTDIGAIGFHGIPVRVSDGTDYQTEAELGTRLSGGCQRQANPDAAFMWQFAQVGTPVVVV